MPRSWWRARSRSCFCLRWVDKCAPSLRSNYITILEVGGAFAHRFEGLLTFIRIPYLIITDLDSVEPTGHQRACRGDVEGARTSNASLKKLSGKTTVAELIALTKTEKVNPEKDCCFAFQVDVVIEESGDQLSARPRTLEEALAYQNYSLLRSGALDIGITLPPGLPDLYEAVYSRVKSDDFKKTDFAMKLLASASNWTVPTYIAEGLKWLEGRLSQGSAPPTVAVVEVTAGAAA